MRELNIGTKRLTRVTAEDKPGAGGACHEYKIYKIGSEPYPINIPFASISFQCGPIKENGVNGCHQEDLLAIVIDRLQCFQAGDFSCKENADALSLIEHALCRLNARTAKRIERGVEGTSHV